MSKPRRQRSKPQKPVTNEDTEQVCRFLWEKRAHEIVVIDVGELTLLTDRLIVCTATSRVHVRALAEELLAELKGQGLAILNVEGYQEGLWVIVDLGAAMVHVFEPDMRAFYDLERLWGDAPQTTFEPASDA